MNAHIVALDSPFQSIYKICDRACQFADLVHQLRQEAMYCGESLQPNQRAWHHITLNEYHLYVQLFLTHEKNVHAKC